MPNYKVKHPNTGEEYTLKAKRQPTEEEIIQFFDNYDKENQAKKISESLVGLFGDQKKSQNQFGFLDNLDNKKNNTKAEKPVGFFKNAWRTFGGAGRDVIQSTLDLGYDIDEYFKLGGISWADNPNTEEKEGLRFIGYDERKELEDYYGDAYKLTLPKVEEPTYMGGSFVRDVSGFLVPYTKVSKIGKVFQPVSNTGKVLKYTTQGAVAEQFAFSPDESRLSNLIESYPSLQNPVTDFLQADPNDSAAVSRLKMALEGAGLGLAFEGIFLGLRTLKKNRSSEVPPKPDEITTPKPDEITTPKPDEATTVPPKPDEIAQSFKIKDPSTQVDVPLNKDGTPDKRTKAYKEQNFAGNINLDKIKSTDDVKNLLKEISEKNNNFVNARRGKIRFGSQGEELKKLADETGLTVNELLKRKPGEAFNVEYITAARLLNIRSANELFNLSKKIESNQGTNLDLVNFENALNKHVAIQEQVAGITAEAGRALRGFKEIADSEGALKDSLIKDLVREKGSNIKDIARKMSQLDTPQQISNFARNVRTATTMDQIQEVWINALLSSPSTHAVNIISNALVAATRMPEYAGAAVMGLFRRGDDKVYVNEFLSRVLGSLYGTLDGFRSGGRALIDPESIKDPLTKTEIASQKSIKTPLKVFGYDLIGDTVRLPGRALVAEDTFFKSIGYRQELWGQAIRQANREGKGIKRAFEILENPTKNFPEIELKARDTARYQTFTNPVGKSLGKLQDFIGDHKWLRFIVPFFRTPVNIVKYAAQRTPLGIFSRTYKEAIKKGGAEADLARSRVILGSSVAALVTHLSSQGYITGGGPADPKEKANLRQTGWQEYSIRIGDKYYAYNRFEPVGILFGLAADAADIAKYIEEDYSEDDDYSTLLAMIATSVAKNLTNKTFLSGITSAINAMSDPERYGESFINRFISSFVPTISYYQRKSTDPIVRDAQSTSDFIKNRIPGLSKTLPAKRNILGEVIEYTPNYAPDFMGEIGETFSPLQVSEIKDDIVFNEFLRLDLSFSNPRRVIDGIKLNAEQYEQMLINTKNLGARSLLESIIKSNSYKNLSDENKRELLTKTIRGIQKLARTRTLLTDRELLKSKLLNKE